jgi:hypothetical protein
MIGNALTRVSSAVHDFTNDPRMDFAVAPSGEIQLHEPARHARQQTWAMFSDDRAQNPLGLQIVQESFLLDPPNDDYVVVRYILKNTGDEALSDLHFGIYLDWDIISYNGNAGGYDQTGEYAWMAHNAGSTTEPDLSIYRGVKLLEGPFAAAGAVVSTTLSYPPVWDPPGDGFTDAEKFTVLTSGLAYAEINQSERDDLFMFVSSGQLTLAPGAYDTVTFAILAAGTKVDMDAVAARAESIYTDVDEPDDGPELPRQFTLYQNYPNPFNPSTVISFDMPVRGVYVLEIFNVLGQQVWSQRRIARPGRVDVMWDAEAFSSGVYFYRVSVGDLSQTRKMLLLK